MDCCCNLIQRGKPAHFATQVVKYLQHANWHVREGVLLLIVRCILIAGSQEPKRSAALKPNMAGETTAVGQICTNAQMIEEICFLVKVEDKKQLQSMGVDTLALMIAKSSMRNKTDALIMKELGVVTPSDAQQKSQLGQAINKDNQLYAAIQQRVRQPALPFLNGQEQVEFAPSTTGGQNA